MNSDEILIFDTGPLSHFARQNWLGVLKAVVGVRGQSCRTWSSTS